MEITYWLNIIGLIFDMIGVIGLFNTKIAALGKFEKPEIRKMFSSNSAEHNGIMSLYYSLITMIEKTNEKNKKAHDKSIKWLLIIIIGFLCQLSSSFIGVFSMYNHSYKITPNSSRNHCCKNY